MKCPVDNATLLITDRSGIEIDYCPECRGVWLDRGELDKLIQDSSRGGEYTSNRDGERSREQRYSDDDDRRYDQRDSRNSDSPHKKKESFLGDIFDF
jgi:Zn-finger nucleic acid-binding protein